MAWKTGWGGRLGISRGRFRLVRQRFRDHERRGNSSGFERSGVKIGIALDGRTPVGIVAASWAGGIYQSGRSRDAVRETRGWCCGCTVKTTRMWS